MQANLLSPTAGGGSALKAAKSPRNTSPKSNRFS